MSRYDQIMAQIAAGTPAEEIAKAWHTTPETIAVYERAYRGENITFDLTHRDTRGSYTDGEKTLIVKLWRDSKDVYEVAKALHLSYEGVRKFLQREGILEKRRVYKFHTPEELARVINLYQSGMKSAEIVREVGMTRCAVDGILYRAGMYGERGRSYDPER